MRKTLLPCLFLASAFAVQAQSPQFPQSPQFAPLKGNSQSIVSTFLDRDSAMLFALDKAGIVVVWDVNRMTPIRSFNTVPSDILSYEDRSGDLSDSRDVEIGVNRNKFWIVDKSPWGLDGVMNLNAKSGVFDIYGRVTGRHYGQSDTATVIDRIYLFRNDEGLLMTRCFPNPFYENGQMAYGALNYFNSRTEESRMAYLTNVATCLQVSDDEQYLAVGYRFGGVDVFRTDNFEKVWSSSPPENMTVDEVKHIRFLAGNKGIAYTYGLSGGGKVFLHYTGEDAPRIIDPQIGHGPCKIEVSPSGNHLAVFGGTGLNLYNLQGHSFSGPAANYLISINDVAFLDENVLLLAGTEAILGAKAALFKYDWRKGYFSSNLSGDDGSWKLLKGTLSVIDDTTFRISNPAGGYTQSWEHIISPASLENFYAAFDLNTTLALSQFLEDTGLPQPAAGNSLPEGQQSTMITDDLPSKSSRFILPLGNGRSALVKTDPKGAFSLEGELRHMDGFTPFRIHSGSRLVLWRGSKWTGPGSKTPILLTDYEGHIHLRDSVESFLPFCRFSPDGNWLAFERSGSLIVYTGTAPSGRRVELPTGLPQGMYFPVFFQFNGQSSELAYRMYDAANPAAFTLMKTSLQSGEQKKLFSFPMMLNTFGLDEKLQHIAFSSAINVADPKLIADSALMATSARYWYRNLYQPIIIYTDVEMDDPEVVIPVKNGQPVARLALTKDRIVSLQNDGLLYYYDLTDTSQVYVHHLQGQEQALLVDAYYYASEGMLDRIGIRTPSGLVPVGKQDVLYNQPHNIMKVLGNTRSELTGLYEAAYRKRLQQYEGEVPAFEARKMPAVNIDQASALGFYVEGPLLRCKVSLEAGGQELPGEQQLYITVNGYSPFGKEGLSFASGKNSRDLDIPLDSGYNEIILQAKDQNNRYSAPLKLNYLANYSPPASRPKLWILSAGVSRYADSTYNLRYAAKDAGDIVKVFTYKDNYDTLLVTTLLDGEVTSKNVLGELEKAQSLKKDDVVIVYLAGHGLLDEDANFYFATHDIDFDTPGRNGLDYRELIAGLEAIPSKNKVLLLDACHSGLVDRSQLAPQAQTALHESTSGDITLQNPRGFKTGRSNRNLKEEDVFLFMHKVFSDFAQDNNISVLSASLGNSFALENDRLRNGLFTYSLIKAIGLAKATDRYQVLGNMITVKAGTDGFERRYAESSAINIADIQRYVLAEVSRLSHGRQVPSFTLSRNAEQIVFAEGSFPNYLLGIGNYTPYGETPQPTKGELYKSFLDRYKDKAE